MLTDSDIIDRGGTPIRRDLERGIQIFKVWETLLYAILLDIVTCMPTLLNILICKI
jgi:hypothetical protein